MMDARAHAAATSASSVATSERPAPPLASARLKRDHHARLLLGCVFCFVYAYFFQGGGWNQNSHFDTVRSFVERHAADITPIAANTGDVGYHDGKVYSNKGPGLALWLTPVYFVLYQLERHAGAGNDVYWWANFNAHVLTFFASGLPGVGVVLLLFEHFRRQYATTAESLCLAGGFGAGSLLFPYAGVMMSHVFSAWLLFMAWHLMRAAVGQRRQLLLAGLLTAMAVVTDLLSAPVALLFLSYVACRKPWRQGVGFVGGAALIAALFLIYNQLTFGSAFTTHQTLESHQFQTPGLVLGMLQRPQWPRLYWLTIHPFRGLFYCCPVLLLPLLSWLPWPRTWRVRAVPWEKSIPLCVIATFVLFNLSFNGWTGGWGVGPRYLIPMLPFLFSFALPGFRRWPTVSMLLMTLSAVLMLSIAAVELMVPSPNGGAARPLNPVADSLRQLRAGDISLSTQGMLDYVPVRKKRSRWASYNLGELVGLTGLDSVTPPAFALTTLAGASFVMYRRREAGRRGTSPDPR
jgi:hypothetical protein